MKDTTHERPIPVLSSRLARWLASLGILAAALAICVPIYAGWPSGATATFRFGMPLLWGALALAAARVERTRLAVPVLLGLFGMSLGFAFAYLVGSRPIDFFGLSVNTPKGAAIAKVLSEVIPVCAAISLAAWASRKDLASLGLRGGRVGLSLALGMLATIPLLLLAVFDPSGGTRAVLATPAATLASWLPWILLFSIGNGFMEELWFRGLWLGAFRQALGWPAAIHVTSAAFALMHVIVYWGDPVALAILTPTWLFMAYGYALTMRKTGSIWGPVLAHAIADVLFLFIAFSAGKM